MAKIVLISTDECIVGMGVKTLSGCLIEAGFDVSVLLMCTGAGNYKNFSWTDLVDICQDSVLIGISCMTHGLKKAIEVKEALKRRLSIPIIIGGIHASAVPETLSDSFDFICHGEGEDLIVELAKRLSNYEPIFDIPGLWINQQNGIIKNTNSPLKYDLNDYPFPDYDLSHQFILQGTRLVTVKPTPEHIPFDNFVVLGSRGCPHHCAYCSTQKIREEFPWRKTARPYRVDYLINHLKEVCLVYPGVRSFWIEDDTFFVKSCDEITEFSLKYKQEVNKPFIILISPWTFSEDKVRLLVEAGMDRMIMGIQSGSENVNRNIYERDLSNDRTLEIVGILHKYPQMKAYYDFIGMNPFEKEEDLIETIRFIRRFPQPFFISNNNLAFYPGTKLYEKAHQAGIDVGQRTKHTESTIGYSILKNENIQHKVFHFILLLMAGDANEFRIGYVPRFLISDYFLGFYSFLNRRLRLFTNFVISTISFLGIYEPLRKVVRVPLRGYKKLSMN